MDSVRGRLQLPDNSPVGAKIRIAVIDTGVDPDHPDLVGVVDLAESQSFARLSTDITDRHYHGTHVAGIIAGSGEASHGRFRGVAPGATLLVYKVATRDKMDEGAVAAAIAAAIDARVDIINYSASHSPSQRKGAPPWIWAKRSPLEDAFEQATAAGILCVASAGNDGLYFGKILPSTINRPAGSEHVLTVGNATADDRVSQQSSRGPYLISPTLRSGGVERFDEFLHKDVEKRPKPDVVAPGESIVAPRTSRAEHPEVLDAISHPDHGQYYVPVSGTSQATAVVSGLAALVLEEVRRRKIPLGDSPALTLKTIIMRAARRLGEGTRMDFGSGLPDWPGVLEVLEPCSSDTDYLHLLQSGRRIQAI